MELTMKQILLGEAIADFVDFMMLVCYQSDSFGRENKVRRSSSDMIQQKACVTISILSASLIMVKPIVPLLVLQL